MDKFAEIRKKAVPILKPYITQMAIFGSTVRGETTEGSDIDLLIRLKPSKFRPQTWFIQINGNRRKPI